MESGHLNNILDLNHLDSLDTFGLAQRHKKSKIDSTQNI
jgi:hypothetical protein